MAISITTWIGIILLVLGLLLTIIGIILIVARRSGEPVQWYMWLLVVGGALLSLLGLILLAVGLITAQEEKARELNYEYYEIQQRPQATTQPRAVINLGSNTSEPTIELAPGPTRMQQPTRFYNAQTGRY